MCRPVQRRKFLFNPIKHIHTSPVGSHPQIISIVDTKKYMASPLKLLLAGVKFVVDFP